MGNPPAGAIINPCTGDFAWTPGPAQTGTNTIAFKVSNNGPPFFTVTGNLPVVVLAPAPELISVMRLSASQVTIQWQCMAGKTYRVQFRNELGQGAWQDLSADLIAGGSTLSFNDTSPSPAQRFYRIVQLN
jgi:hypothetical protein